MKHDIKLSLTFYSTIIGASFLLVFGLLSLKNQSYILAAYLLGPLSLGLANFLLLRTTKKSLASINLAVISGIISLMLVAHGGNAQTGFLWTYPLVTIAISILHFRQGVWFVSAYLALSALLLFAPPDAAFFTEYQSVTASRYLFSCLALCAITLTLVNIQEKMTSQLHTKTITDDLTGLYNRGIIRSELDTTYANQDALRKASLIMLDIDFFKNVNDEYGHAVGDKVLVTVSEILQTCMRINDLAIRWGGEEFLLILRDCTIQDALDKAALINQTLSEHSELQNLLHRDITVSMGISEMAVEDDLYESIKQADINLYKAKAAGRNQVIYDQAALN